MSRYAACVSVPEVHAVDDVEAAFVARFLITALEHDRDESVVMAVARAQFVRMMVEQPERRIGETG